ncbi:HpcH/HpaI aldolase/citrate lyase family protein [Halalkalibacter nanhaiisediminis]|uniref:Citrate lyase subunit beta/citryl-CoA lyase n=1 Tax=Halalkalibacter nanhaiisediminis TaxID=688079 RepID=A0A562QMZ0_9BACI|nr:CoA ester lyase [Halalkalibacter nanhaiisediminis]TWI58118.1 citrate lyase subunit beta/citryl-CoA lyase [Halalkalibacter nanhaiisediminis]
MNCRSYLFVPGNNTTVIEKAMNSPVDAVIIDLEDAVAIAEKEHARKRVTAFLQQKVKFKQTYIRINDCHSSFLEKDVAAAVQSGVHGIMLPKAESKKELVMVCELIHQQMKLLDLGSTPFEVIPLIETAKGVENTMEIASAHSLISRVAFGSIDYSLDIDCELTKDGMELLYARSKIVNASRAAGIESPIDAVYPNLGDEKGFLNETERAKMLGFKAKLIIHPKQIDVVHKVLSPNQEELEKAKTIVAAFEKAEKDGVGAVTVGNQLVDYPVYKRAMKLLKIEE